MSARTRRLLTSSWAALFVFSLLMQSGALAAPATSLGASLTVDLDQYANGGKTSAAGWQNGDLNGNNSTYSEGKVVPFRLAIEGLSAGQHTIHIDYDFTAGGHEAYDFLATYDATESPAVCGTGGGGVSSLCPVGAPSSLVDFQSDPFVVAAGKSVAGAEAYAGVGRKLSMWGGTIDSLSVPTHSGSVTGNSTGDILVTFTSTGPAAFFAWGGHLAQSAYWLPGDPNGAGQINGAPWHMRTLNLDDGGASNQDRSIQPSALVQPPALSITKTADAASVSAGSPIGFTITVTNSSTAGPAQAVNMSDPLPGGSGISWSIAGTTGSPTCSISGSAPTQTLSCTKATLAAGASFGVHVTSGTTAAACGVHDNTATVSAENDAAVQASASITVDCAAIAITKVADAHVVAAGDQIGFTVTVSNNGAGAATGVHVVDTLPTDAGTSWSIDGSPSGDTTGLTCAITAGVLTCDKASLAAGHSFSLHIVSPTTAATVADSPVVNTATVTTLNDGSGQASDAVRIPALAIAKSFTGNSLPPLLGNPQAAAGDTLTYTLAYTIAMPPVTNAVITDVLPAGQTYVASSAAGNAEFTFQSYDATSRTLTWSAATATKSGSVTYRVTIDTGAASLTQPLINTATIKSDQTDPVSATASVFVPAPPEAITQPPTSALSTPQPGNPGFSLMLLLLGLAGFALALGYVTPVPERARRRDRD